MLGCVAGVIGGDDGEDVAGLGFIIRINVEGDLTGAVVDGEGGSVVVVIGFKGVGDGGVVCCGGGIDQLV